MQSVIQGIVLIKKQLQLKRVPMMAKYNIQKISSQLSKQLLVHVVLEPQVLLAKAKRKVARVPRQTILAKSLMVLLRLNLKRSIGVFLNPFVVYLSRFSISSNH